MKLTIKEYCIRCGICEDLHGDIFWFDHESDSIKIKYDVIPPELEEDAKKAMAECSIAAIHLVK